MSDEARAGRALLWRGLQLGVTRSLYLVGTLVLGRLLTPGDFGLVAIATVTITTVMAATDTGMTAALVQSATREEIHYHVAWTVGLLRGALLCAAILVAAPWVAAMFGNVRAVPLIRLMAFMPLLSSIGSPRLADVMRELKFGRLAVIALAAVIAELTLAIMLAARFGGAAIIIGKVAGAATICATSYFVAPYRPRIRLSVVSTQQLISFGRWIFGIGLIAAASDLLLKVLVSRRLGVGGLGLYSLADRLAEAPSQLANEAVAAVALPLYARLREDPPRVRSVLRAHLTGLMFFLLPATALLIALAQPLEQRVLGAAWTGSSRLIVLLALGFAAEVGCSATVPLFQAFGQGSRLFAVEVIQYVALIACLLAFTGTFGLIGVGLARIVAALVVQTASAYAASDFLGPIVSSVLRSALWLLVLATSGGTAAWFAASLVAGTPGVVVGLLAGACLFLLLAWFADVPLRIGIRESLSAFFPFLGGHQPRAAVPP